ncbi:MAG: transcription elongation factor GreA [Candidatus Magasanikbacteria bacterium]|nr:transcription elongation factor GreA [Candidatus Magasanikbacteria bacterium]
MSTQTFVSAARLQELKDELRDMKTVTIPKIAAQIDDAKQNGDLSENAEYQDAKERMEFAHGRVAELEQLLSNAVVIDDRGKGSSKVHIGSTIIVETAGIQKTFMIVGSTEADPTDGKISNESPLGEAFLGHEVGDEVEVVTPVKTTYYTIAEIK